MEEVRASDVGKTKVFLVCGERARQSGSRTRQQPGSAGADTTNGITETPPYWVESVDVVVMVEETVGGDSEAPAGPIGGDSRRGRTLTFC